MVGLLRKRRSARLWLGLLPVMLMLAPGCSGSRARLSGTAESHFADGEMLFARGKWDNAAEEFNWVVLNNPAHDLAAEAQYFYAECLYQQRLYVEAQLEFERLLRRWAAGGRMVQARYRIVQSLVAQSPKYYYQQTATEDALEELQAFIDEFPESAQKPEAEQLILDLRSKLARKLYESGRQYLKWRVGQSARLYFEQVLDRYYDTPYASQALTGIVISYIVEEDLDGAEAYLAEISDQYADAALREQDAQFIAAAREGKFDLALFFKIYQ